MQVKRKQQTQKDCSGSMCRPSLSQWFSNFFLSQPPFKILKKFMPPQLHVNRVNSYQSLTILRAQQLKRSPVDLIEMKGFRSAQSHQKTVVFFNLPNKSHVHSTLGQLVREPPPHVSLRVNKSVGRFPSKCSTHLNSILRKSANFCAFPPTITANIGSWFMDISCRWR